MKNIKNFNDFITEKNTISKEDNILTEKKKKKAPKKEDAPKCDDKDTKKDDDKDTKKIDVNKSDEQNYLSAKQRKLPDGLKKGIIARAKKAKK